MAQERDPRLGDIGDLEVEEPKKGVPVSRPGQGGGKGGGRGGGERPPRKPSGGGGGQGPWLGLSLALLALVLVMGAYFYRQVSTLQARLDEELSESTQELENVQSRLSATDESLSQSANTIEDRLQFHMDEIRKLWDVSNKRNKGWIEENQRNISNLQTATAKVRKRLDALEKEVKGFSSRLASAADARGRMQTQLDLVAETVQQMEDTVAEQRKSMSKLEGLQKDWQAMDKRMQEIDAAIQAFDTWRVQVNNRLQALESGGGAG